MNVDIYIRETDGNREIRIPWLPDEIHYSTGEASMASYEIIDKGEVIIPTGVGLSEYSWESIFPGEGRKNSDCGLMRGSWNDPASYHNTLIDWKAKSTKLNLVVVGYPINKTVYLVNYTGTGSGGFGDMVYSVEFKEVRKASVFQSNGFRDLIKRSTDDSQQTVVVKKGDTLWALAEKHLGNGALWTKIYNLNYEIIEKTAKNRWTAAGILRGSENGKWIFPGTVLKLP